MTSNSRWIDGIIKRDRNSGRVMTIAFLLLVFSAVLAACNLLGGPSCPVDDERICDFVEELEPLIESLDSDAIWERAALECCKGDFAWPDEEVVDPEAPCIRSGAYRGESTCLTDEEFWNSMVRQAPLSVDYLVRTHNTFSDLTIDMSNTAILVSTGDPEWFLVFFVETVFGEWRVTAVLQVSREALSQFDDAAFESWPLDLETPNLPPGASGGVG